MRKPLDITSPDQVNLVNHAVIEASAGTGKTYTIEKMVLRLIKEKVKIDQILLVTFTEKATGELKLRIRAALEDESEKDSEFQDSFITALASFADANIYTIHGFCQKVLREFAFDNRCAFELEHVSDKDVYLKIFNRMKREWAYDLELKELLEENYSSKTDETILDLAGKMKEGDAFEESQLSEPWNLFLLEQTLRLQELVRHYKEEKSFISYDDMIANVCRALNESGGDILKDNLQEKFQVGLIDEFQDTDMQQWEIFKSIFVEDSESTGNRIFVVGDPKQAIYSFRGADINAYLMARKELLDINSDYYNLPVNRRSMPDLIQSVNGLVSSAVWFGQGSDDEWSINFKDVEYQDEDARRESRGPLLHKDETGDPALNFIEYSRKTSKKINKSPLENDLSKTIVDKIAELNGRMTFTVKGIQRQLKYSDICILVRKSGDFSAIEEQLRSQKIPYTYYKKKGIYQSRAADNYLFFFEALANPSSNTLVRKALITDFFGLSPQQIDSFESLEVDHELKTFWLKCLDLAANRSWGLLFKVMLHESGVLRRCYIDNDEHSAAAYEQLANEYMKAAIDENLNVSGLVKKINYLYDAKSDGDENLHEKESELDAVQIMTLHTSKGLEFPVVFVYGDFTSRDYDKIKKYYCIEKKTNVFAVKEGLSEEIKNKADAAELEEDKRLYYVAATRAIFKLYLLKVDPEIYKTSSPLFTLIYSSISDQLHAETINGEELLPEVQKTVDEAEEDFANIQLPTEKLTSFRRRKTGIYSFSSLTALESDSSKTYFSDINLSAERDDDQTDNTDVRLEDRLILPRGAQTGELLHDILENLDYSLLRSMKNPCELLENEQTAKCIQTGIDKYPLGEDRLIKHGVEIDSYPKALCRMIYNTLMTPIDELQGIRFADIDTADRRHEMSFYMPTADKSAYLNGIIDLLFRVKRGDQDIYYVLDWKTTSIMNGYSKENIAQSMQEKNYILQYQLYSYAVIEWFKQFAGPDAVLGGSLYIYTRGMNLQNPETGVYFDSFEGDADSYRDRVVKLVEKAQRGGA